MSDFKEQMEKELDELKQLRDELKLQANLGAKELKEAWGKLEERWPEVEKRIKDAEEKSSEAIGTAAKSFVSELKKAYQQVKEEIASHKPEDEDEEKSGEG